MNVLKVLLTVLLTLLIVVAGFAAQILAAVDLTVLSPWFYKTGLDKMGVYENLRIIILDQIDSFIDQQISIPDKFKDDALKVAENVFTKSKVSSQMGEFLGGSAEYVLKGKGDAVIPIKRWIEELGEELDNSSLVEDIIDFEIDKGSLLLEKKESYFTPYRNMILSTYTTFPGYAGYAVSLLGSKHSLSELIFMFAPSKELQESFENRFWVFRFWTVRANVGAYVSIAAVVLFIALLFFVWRKNKGVAFKILCVLFMVNAVLYILMGIGLLLSITVAKMFNIIPPAFVPFTALAQSLINPLALFTLGVGIIFMAAGIILSVVGGALVKKSADLNAAKVETTLVPEVNEIEYIPEPDTELPVNEDTEISSSDTENDAETEGNTHEK